MREMKDSGVDWIGEIPKEWTINKYKCFASSGMGSTILASETTDKGIPIYSATKDGTIFGYMAEPSIILKKGDLVIPARGNSIGYVTFVANEATCTQTTIYSKLNNNIFAKFLYYCCLGLADKWFEYDDTAIPQITVKQVQNNLVPVPSIREQMIIAAYLDSKCTKIDTIIEKQHTVIEKLKEYKLSLITETVTKGLKPDVPMKDSGLRWVKNIPAGWENRKLISVLGMRVVDGPHESPELFSEGIPYISATAIENGKINFSLMRGYISKEYCDVCDVRYKPQKGDILVIKLGASTGQVAIVETNIRFNIWVPLAAVRCNEQAYPYFVYYAFQSDYFLRQMELSWTYGTQQTLGVKTIEQLRIMLPPIEEQRQIADFLDRKCSAIDATISKKQALIEKLTAYKKSLIYEVVTGKKEV